MKYKVTLYLEANTHPRKWVPETIWEALNEKFRGIIHNPS